MFSIRNAMMVMGAAALLVSGVGCQKIYTEKPAEIDRSPLVVDGAMELRNWDRTTAFYQNGGTVAEQIAFEYRPADEFAEMGFMDPLLFLGETIILPYTLLTAPPTRVYRGEVIEPTYTAQVPLPEGDQPISSIPESQRPKAKKTAPPPAPPVTPADPEVPTTQPAPELTTEPASAPGTRTPQP